MSEVPKAPGYMCETIEGVRRDTAEVSPSRLVCDLALSALDAQEAAREGVTEGLILGAVGVYTKGSRKPRSVAERIGDVVRAVHPAIFAAGERAGLEKAESALERGGLSYQAIAKDTSKSKVERRDAQTAAITLAHAQDAIRSLKGGTP